MEKVFMSVAPSGEQELTWSSLTCRLNRRSNCVGAIGRHSSGWLVVNETEREGGGTYSSQPPWNGVSAVTSYVRIDDDDGQECWQRYENHIDAEVRACQPHSKSLSETIQQYQQVLRLHSKNYNKY